MDLLKCAKKQIMYYLVNFKVVIKKMTGSYKLDCSGLVCPMPVAKTKRKLLEMNRGDVLEVTGDYAEAGQNIKRYLDRREDKILDFKTEGENFYLKIEKA